MSNICTLVIIVGKMTGQSWKRFKLLHFFQTFHTISHHFQTVEDGKLKLSQIVHIEEIFS